MDIVLIVAGTAAVCFICGIFCGVLMYAIHDGIFDCDLSKPHDHYD